MYIHHYGMFPQSMEKSLGFSATKLPKPRKSSPFQGLPAPAEPQGSQAGSPLAAVRVRFEDPLDPLDPLKPLDDDGELEKKFSKLLKTLRERLLDEDLMLADEDGKFERKLETSQLSQFLFPICCSFLGVSTKE